MLLTITGTYAAGALLTVNYAQTQAPFAAHVSSVWLGRCTAVQAQHFSASFPHSRPTAKQNKWVITVHNSVDRTMAKLGHLVSLGHFLMSCEIITQPIFLGNHCDEQLAHHI